MGPESWVHKGGMERAGRIGRLLRRYHSRGELAHRLGGGVTGTTHCTPPPFVTPMLPAPPRGTQRGGSGGRLQLAARVVGDDRAARPGTAEVPPPAAGAGEPSPSMRSEISSQRPLDEEVLLRRGALRHAHHLVRLDALRRDAVVLRREPARHCDANAAAVLQLAPDLDGVLAVGGLPHDRAPPALPAGRRPRSRIADADPPLTSTTSGMSRLVARPSPVASQSVTSPPDDSWVR